MLWINGIRPSAAGAPPETRRTPSHPFQEKVSWKSSTAAIAVRTGGTPRMRGIDKTHVAPLIGQHQKGKIEDMNDNGCSQIRPACPERKSDERQNQGGNHRAAGHDQSRIEQAVRLRLHQGIPGRACSAAPTSTSNTISHLISRFSRRQPSFPVLFVAEPDPDSPP